MAHNPSVLRLRDDGLAWRVVDSEVPCGAIDVAEREAVRADGSPSQWTRRLGGRQAGELRRSLFPVHPGCGSVIPRMSNAYGTAREYEPPELTQLGGLHELTLGCDKTLGSTDGFTFMGQQIVCSSATP